MKEEISILLIDDEESFREILSQELSLMDFRVVTGTKGEEVPAILNREEIDVVLLDLKLPGISGLETLKIIKEINPSIEIIMLTAYGSIDNAVESIKLGAYYYLTKPCKLDELEVLIRKAYEKRQLSQQYAILKQELARRDEFPELIGNSIGLNRTLELVKKVALTDSTVLIIGESGVGKELVARSIHKASLRRDKPFVVLDCSSLQESLIENELFGHEKGAYTGATHLKHGLLEVADSGTLFMDEIGEITPIIQMKLLRVLETRSFKRVGGTKDIKVDIRLISATNKDLQEMVKKGSFREDLFYRLNIFPIHIPPLRERREDIALLAKYFVRHSKATGKKDMKISPEAMELLIAYDWPGNIRELQNVIERALILSDDKYIRPKDLPPNLKTAPKLPPTDDSMDLLPLEEIEKKYILTVLERCKGHRARAAEILKISEATLYRRLREYNIPPNNNLSY
jgi:DNA-binding NtrC family response regulator